jgi:hypothetical protein
MYLDQMQIHKSATRTTSRRRSDRTLQLSCISTTLDTAMPRTSRRDTNYGYSGTKGMRYQRGSPSRSRSSSVSRYASNIRPPPRSHHKHSDRGHRAKKRYVHRTSFARRGILTQSTALLMTNGPGQVTGTNEILKWVR